MTAAAAATAASAASTAGDAPAVRAVQQAPQGAALPDVDAIVTHEVTQVLASGVTRIDRWAERRVRRGDEVWIERVLPAVVSAAGPGHGHDESAGHRGHRHLDAQTSAHWITKAPDGSIVLRLVDRVHRVVVAVPRAEFTSVGFDGRFDAAASLIPPAIAASLAPEADGSPGEAWRSERAAGWHHRVRWSDALQMALQVESRRDDGSVRRSVVVTLQPDAGVAVAAPWQRLDGFATRYYDEYMD